MCWVPLENERISMWAPLRALFVHQFGTFVWKWAGRRFRLSAVIVRAPATPIQRRRWNDKYTIEEHNISFNTFVFRGNHRLVSLFFKWSRNSRTIYSNNIGTPMNDTPWSIPCETFKRNWCKKYSMYRSKNIFPKCAASNVLNNEATLSRSVTLYILAYLRAHIEPNWDICS